MTTTVTSKLAGGLSCTYGMTNQGNGLSFQVLLPNGGRNVELCSKEGADEFVDTVGTAFISTNLTAVDDEELTVAYQLIFLVAQNTSPEKIASGIPESELRTFTEYTRNTLDTLSIDRDWFRSGTILKRHELLIQAVDYLAEHPPFLKTFLSDKGMEVVAKFYASRKKNDTPNVIVAQSIVFLVNNALLTLTREGVSYEKAFGTIEKTGLLGQFIRCVPVHPEHSSGMVTRLLACLQLVRKKLNSGTRTGEILDAVIAGNDGPINEEAKSSLTRLQILARLANNNNNNNNDNYDNYDNKITNLKAYHHCDKMETLGGAKLMKCKRCKVTYYCSKYCQVADWKNHKELCNQTSSGVVSRSEQKASETTMMAFIKSNCFDIAKEVYNKTQEYGVPKKELLLELDFYGDAPALRNEFKVWLTSGFLVGSSVSDAPSWFRTDAEKRTLERYLRNQYEKATSNNLLSVCRAANGMVTVQLLCLPATNAGLPVARADYQLLSDEAVESIGIKNYVRMVACLGQPITAQYFEKRSGLKWHMTKVP